MGRWATSLSLLVLAGCETMPAPVDALVADAAIAPDGALRDAGLDPEDAAAADAAVAPDSPPLLDAAPLACGLDAGGPVPTFRALYADIIGPYRCGECHDGARFDSSLDLTSPEAAYASLVGVLGCDDVTLRVEPCAPSRSTFAMVPTGRDESCGVRHTSGGTFPTGIVTPEEAARIDAWIAAGAAF